MTNPARPSPDPGSAALQKRFEPLRQHIEGRKPQSKTVELGDWEISLSLLDENTLEVTVNHDVRVDEHPTLVQSAKGSDTHVRTFRVHR
jgi:hypothetical protein